MMLPVISPENPDQRALLNRTTRPTAELFEMNIINNRHWLLGPLILCGPLPVPC